MEVEGRMSWSGDAMKCINKKKKSFFKGETHLAIYVLTKYISGGNINHEFWGRTVSFEVLQNGSHQTSDESSADWDIQRIKKKKCCDWKPGKLMSLHFYLLNLYRLLCQGLWGFSVPSLVIVFSLFAWESDTFSWNLGGGIHLQTFSHGKDEEGREKKITVNYGYCCSEIKMTKKRPKKKESCLKWLQRVDISQLHLSCNAA